MAQESRTPKSNDPREVYRQRTVEILDEWKSGTISSTEAHQQHDDAIADMVHALYNAWHVRMRTLDAWCTPHAVWPTPTGGR